MDSFDSHHITDPESRHNIHVTRRSDIEPVEPWSRDTLYAAVKRADKAGAVVVLDYGREQLWFADSADLTYVPPAAVGHGFGTDPGLIVEEPRLFDPGSGEVRRSRASTRDISPEFDTLIPAFDWEELDESVVPPEVRFDQQPTDSSTETPSGS